LVDTFPGFLSNLLNVSTNRKRRIALPVMKSFLVNSKADSVKSIVSWEPRGVQTRLKRSAVMRYLVEIFRTEI
jgi:hypothetical protein